jgi:hypothetical protein
MSKPNMAEFRHGWEYEALLPGIPVRFDMLRPKPGDKIELKLVDGSCRQQ